jgi:hypothetical protein
MMQGMVIDMEEARLQIVAQVKAFFTGHTTDRVCIASRPQSLR